MKIVSFIILTIMLAGTCSQEKDLKEAAITYTATSRGRFSKVEVKNDRALVYASHDKAIAPTEVIISPEKQKALVAAFNEIDLDSLPTYKAPSDRRFYDGAAIGRLTIVYKGKTYDSQPFDDGNPPAGIAKLVNEVTALRPE